MKFRNVLLASAMLVLPLAAAKAQPVAGPYISLGGGMNIMQQVPVTAIGGVGVSGVNLQTNIGGTGVLAGGWGFGNNVRAELEFDYRYNSIDKVTVRGLGSGTINGNEQKYGPMVNLLYDFNDFSTVTPLFIPTIGVGVGYQWAPLTLSSGGVSASKTAGAFAYQAILGAAVPIPSVPGLALTAEYRFLGLAGDRNYGGDKLGNDFNHSVLIGLRYAFGVAPAPMPEPMPVAEVGAKTFLVFFDWDRSNLTARSEGIVRDAAAYSTRTQYTRIDVSGNTDTSGTPSYNQGLSERRARVVAGELVRDGVPANAISMHAYGDTHLLVPTGPGVREPQNRRVEIVYH
jgi:outer membrane protein OmpA-like peptidoglycan-associated protein